MRLAIVVLCVAACGGAEPEGPAPSAANPPAVAPTQQTASPQLERFAVTTPDGFELVGDLWPGDAGKPAVVLVHQLGSDRREWGATIRTLQRLGATILAIDLRGHAQSALRGGQLSPWRSFEAEDWARLPGDLDLVLDRLKATGVGRFVLVGSSIGSSACLLVAARRPDVAGVVALSPGRAYRGLDVLTSAPQVRAPILAVAAEGEAPAKETSQELARLAPAAEALIVPGAAHGVRMRAAFSELDARIASFVRGVSSGG